MSAVLPDVLDHLVTLLEGTASSIDRPIPTRRFEHITSPLDGALAKAARAPYPFELEDGGRAPLEEEATLSGDQIFDARQVAIRVAYASSPHSHLERLGVVHRDDYTLRRTLASQQSWNAATGLAIATLESSGLSFIELESGTMIVNELVVRLVYREDHTT